MYGNTLGPRMGIDQHLAEIERDLTHQLEQVQNARQAMRRLVDGERPMVPVETLERELRKQRMFLAPQQPEAVVGSAFDNRLSPESDVTEASLKRAACKLAEPWDAPTGAPLPPVEPKPAPRRKANLRGNRLSATAVANITRANKARWAKYRAAKAAKAKAAAKRKSRPARKAARRSR